MNIVRRDFIFFFGWGNTKAWKPSVYLTLNCIPRLRLASEPGRQARAAVATPFPGKLPFPGGWPELRTLGSHCTRHARFPPETSHRPHVASPFCSGMGTSLGCGLPLLPIPGSSRCFLQAEKQPARGLLCPAHRGDPAGQFAFTGTRMQTVREETTSDKEQYVQRGLALVHEVS